MSRRSQRNENMVSFFAFQDIISAVTGIMMLLVLLLGFELIARTGIQGDAETDAPRVDDPVPVSELRANLDRLKEERDRLHRLIAETRGAIAALMERPELSPEQAAQLEADLQKLQEQVRRIATHMHELEVQEAQLTIELTGLSSTADSQQKELEQLQEALRIELRKPDIPAPGAGSEGKKPLYVDTNDNTITVYNLVDGQPFALEQFTGPSAERDFHAWSLGRSPADDYFVLVVRPGGVEHFRRIRDELRRRRFNVSWDAWTEGRTFNRQPQAPEAPEASP